MPIIDSLHCDRCNLSWPVGTRQCDGCAQSFYPSREPSAPRAPHNDTWRSVLARAQMLSGRSIPDLERELQAIVSKWCDDMKRPPRSDVHDYKRELEKGYGVYAKPLHVSIGYLDLPAKKAP